MKEMLEARKRGDSAFRDTEFKAALDFYTQVKKKSISFHYLISKKT